IPAAEIVPGDIILLEEGDRVPADGRLIESISLHTAEAALTGESLPVEKDVRPIDADCPIGDRHNMVLAGTAVTQGHGRAGVTATMLLVEDVSGLASFDVLILGVALAVAAVPEGLPAVVTAGLSIGVQRMAKRYAIVRHLAAVETLGSANVIASDKTGTLTRNE